MIRNGLFVVGVMLTAACAVEPDVISAPEEPGLTSESSKLGL